MDSAFNQNKKYLTFFTVLIVAAALIFVGQMAYPNATRIVLNTLWFMLLSVVIVFVSMGILVLFGLKKEVSKILDMILEGSFSVLDFVSSIRELFSTIVSRIQELVLQVAPVLSYAFAFSVYLMVLYLYKLVGTYYDVTAMTIFLTVTLITFIGIFNLPKKVDIQQIGWKYKLGAKLKSSFSDGIEVVLFIFFLTMDSTELFFVPTELNVPLSAELGSYDLMVRGFHLDMTRVTLSLIIIAITIEILRQVLRLISVARGYYTQMLRVSPWSEQPELDKYQKIKVAIRYSFNNAKDDLLKFITYTTFLILVFLLFPRLKLLSLAVASVTGLLLDLVFPQRLLPAKGNDLISKFLAIVFKV
jgi:hypothetical protein